MQQITHLTMRLSFLPWKIVDSDDALLHSYSETDIMAGIV